MPTPAQGSGATQLAAALTQALSHSPVLLALDFDGTLAPLVDDPWTSRVIPAAHQALGVIAGGPSFVPAGQAARQGEGPQVALALVSGRPLADLAALAHPYPGTYLVGSHGAERGVMERAGLVILPELDDAAAQARIDVWDALAQRAVEGIEGARVERKPLGIAVHVRLVPDAVAKAALLEAAVTWGQEAGAHVRTGHDVAELSVSDTTKGDAIDHLRADVGARAVIYAGDDVTDEDAFARMAPPDVSIKVGAGPTKALFALPSPLDFAGVLAWFATRLPAPPR